MMNYWKTIPRLKSLLAIEAVARLRSFTRAGEELQTSQSAVSHAITEAEQFLETRLFDRSARPVTLTAEGAAYVATLSACLGQLSAETTALRQSKRANTLTISCNLAYGNYWLLPRLKAFHEAHPELQVNMVTTYQGLASMEEGIDVAIRFGRGNWPGLAAYHLFSEQILPVASPVYVAESDVVTTPESLRQHVLLHAHSMDKTWYDWGQWFRHFDVAHTETLPGPTFDNHLLMMQAALSGRGVALGWIGTANEFLREGQLVPVLQQPLVLPTGLYAVTRERVDERITTFLDWVRAYTSSERNELHPCFGEGPP